MSASTSANSIRASAAAAKPAGRVMYRTPPDVEAVFHNFRTCELATLARDGAPQTWPTIPFHQHEDGRFLVTTSVGLPQKAYNVRRDGRVSLLFSDATASGLTHPPTVLVQGDAVCPENVSTSLDGFEDALAQVFKWQPSSAIYSSNPVMRYLMDWYYMRLSIYVTPCRILYWNGGDISQLPQNIEVSYVE